MFRELKKKPMATSGCSNKNTAIDTSYEFNAAGIGVSYIHTASGSKSTEFGVAERATTLVILISISLLL